ncbi:MAG: hypothetical protein LBN38_05740 [Verrucomicrobiota bacterium]|nr:hypothetical protein [Verrucomicrobiota bacterium]
MTFPSKTRLFRVWAVLCFAAACSAPARLYETVAQNDARYGPPSSTNDSVHSLLPALPDRTYAYDGWTLRLSFVRGRAAVIRYSKASHQAIGEDELAVILKAEGRRGRWEQVDSSEAHLLERARNLLVRPKSWRNTKGMTAWFNNPLHTSLTLETPAAGRYRDAYEKTEEHRRREAIPPF